MYIQIKDLIYIYTIHRLNFCHSWLYYIYLYSIKKYQSYSRIKEKKGDDNNNMYKNSMQHNQLPPLLERKSESTNDCISREILHRLSKIKALQPEKKVTYDIICGSQRNFSSTMYNDINHEKISENTSNHYLQYLCLVILHKQCVIFVGRYRKCNKYEKIFRLYGVY